MSTAQEYPWGCELNAENKEYVWEHDRDHHEEPDAVKTFTYSLLLKHAILGVGAREGEVNIVELESEDFDLKKLKHPIARLTAGRKDKCSVDIMLTERLCKLRLIRGSGPVHFWGQLLVDLNDDGDDPDAIFPPTSNTMSSVGEEEEEEEEEEGDDTGFDVDTDSPSATGECEESENEGVDTVIKPIDKPVQKLASCKEDGNSPKKRKRSNIGETAKKVKLEGGDTDGSLKEKGSDLKEANGSLPGGAEAKPKAEARVQTPEATIPDAERGSSKKKRTRRARP